MPWGQAGRLVRLLAVLTLLLAACSAVAAQDGVGQTARGLQQLLDRVQTFTAVGSAQELLQALNSSAGSSVGQLVTLTDNIYLRPSDVAAFAPWLPLNGGNRTVVLAGGKPGAALTTLDFGGAVNLLYHPEGHSFFTYNLEVQGMAPASAGIAAGLLTQMVGGAFWPTTTGEPGHLMGFHSTTIHFASPACGLNATNFTVTALHQVLGRSDTVTLLNDTTYFVGMLLNGSYAVRAIPSGDSAGSVRWSWDNTTVSCFKPQSAAAPPPAPSSPATAAALVANPSATTGVAGSANELLTLLGSPDISRILLGAHIDLHAADWQAYKLPLVLSARSVMVESSDTSPKVLDLGGNPQLLYLSADSSLAFSRVFLQGAAPPSAAMDNRTKVVVGSPLWPTVDGEAGHQLLFYNCTAYVTPCSRNSTQITKDLLRKVLGEAAVVDVGDTAYLIATHFVQPEPIRGIISREQVGITPYTFDSTVISCQEDPAVGLAAELQAEQALPGRPGDRSSPKRGSHPAWVPAVIAVAAVAGAGLAAAAGLLAWRRSQRRRRQVVAEAAAAGGTEQSKAARAEPYTPRGAKMGRMESGDLAEIDEKLQFAAAGSRFGRDSDASDAAGSSIGKSPAGSDGKLSAGSSGRLLGAGSDSGGSQDEARRSDTAAQRLKAGGNRPDVVWRSRFGVIDGLDIAELLGRGAFGKVYRGRWNGAVVAVKVVEHRVSGGDPSSTLSREPLLCMSVSHPNCITTYKLSVIRLLRGEDLLPAEDSLSMEEPEDGSVPPPKPVRLSSDSDDTAMIRDGSSRAGAGQPRMLHSLLSGAEAVEVEDPYGPLQPGLYETWIVSEFCERGTLGDALEDRRLLLPNGRPHMVAVYLCLLDIAAGMQYLHSLGIMHSDLKPANVLLKGTRNSVRGFSCKLADFGLSRMLDGRATHVETGSYGTPTHAAPELLREGRLSPAVDVFAFGVLAWELVAGEEAYRGWHPMQIIMQVTQQGARPPALPHCPPALAALMQRCWRDDPAERPSFSSILTDLQVQLQEARSAHTGPLALVGHRVGSTVTSSQLSTLAGPAAPGAPS
ncbi:hypothetical protein ABPG75_000680 [Micractinium tetrahymenae]